MRKLDVDVRLSPNELRWRRDFLELLARHGSGGSTCTGLCSCGDGDRDRVFGAPSGGDSAPSIPARKCIYNQRSREHTTPAAADTLGKRSAGQRRFILKLIIIFGNVCIGVLCMHASAHRGSNQFVRTISTRDFGRLSNISCSNFFFNNKYLPIYDRPRYYRIPNSNTHTCRSHMCNMSRNSVESATGANAAAAVPFWRISGDDTYKTAADF